MLVLFVILVLCGYVLFDCIRGIKKNARDNNRTFAQEYYHELKTCVENNSPSGAFEIPAGSRTLGTYVYDGRPIPKSMVGRTIKLTIAPGQRTMKSVYTNTVWSDDCTLQYKGRPIGFMRDSKRAKMVKRIARLHGGIAVNGRVKGINRGGWPIVELLLPDDKWLKDKGGLA